MQFKGRSQSEMVAFRSAVLTPILQRQLLGLDDAYTPVVHQAIMGDSEELTIEAVTRFYLKEDPTDPVFIPNYRRNLLYLPIARWHLGRMMGIPPAVDSESNLRYYIQFINNHDRIVEALRATGYAGYDENRFPLLMEAEVKAISKESLTVFFGAELGKYVSDIQFRCTRSCGTNIWHPAIVQTRRHICCATVGGC